MNTLQKIAVGIVKHRGKEQGWKPGTKTADKLNMEAWAGALIALEAVGHADYEHVATYVVMVIASRGYSETVELARKAEATAAAQVAA